MWFNSNMTGHIGTTFTGCKGGENRYYSVFKERCKPLFFIKYFESAIHFI
nr:MAG TPA: hypothetical protein [Caudoviricetes sp.]